MDQPFLSIFPSTFNPMENCYEEFKENGVLIASANIIYSESLAYIMNLEVKDKGKGHGRRIIESLLKNYEVMGVATKDSVEFWKALGATLNDHRDFVIKRRETCV